MTDPIVPFRMLPENLEGLDAKTREGLAPMLEALNTTIQQLVAAAGESQSADTTISTTFSTDGAGAAQVDMKPPDGRPVAVHLDALARVDLAPISTVFSWTWLMAGELVRAYFVGLPADTNFSLTMSLR